MIWIALYNHLNSGWVTFGGVQLTAANSHVATIERKTYLCWAGGRWPPALAVTR